jgi:hypothetical protein
MNSDDPYPRKRLLQFDHVRADGEILHPFAARRDGRADGRFWVIRLYLPFTQEWGSWRRLSFLASPFLRQVLSRSVRRGRNRVIRQPSPQVLLQPVGVHMPCRRAARSDKKQGAVRSWLGEPLNFRSSLLRVSQERPQEKSRASSV